MSAGVFNLHSAFWLLAGVLSGIAITVSLHKLWRHGCATIGLKRATVFGVLGTIAIVAVAAALYASLGRPDLLTVSSKDLPKELAHAPTGGGAESMETATARLAERLARDGGSDADWELLAKSYEFAGQADEAARAREHVATSIAKPVESRQASDALAKARELRLQRKYDEARAAYESVIAMDGMNADGWADYADVLASQNGKLDATSARPIEHALALDPNHTKALWLKASLAHEERRYDDALSDWKRLRSLVGANSSDVAIIDANIAEAEQLAASMPDSGKRLSDTAAAISGVVELDPAIAARVKSGAVLFVYAKGDSPGPPLAVWRAAVGVWPAKFKLDDSMAMMPNRTLSSAKSVVVEARISQSGQATAAAGDLQSTGARVNPRDGKPVRLRIDRVVD